MVYFLRSPLPLNPRHFDWGADAFFSSSSSKNARTWHKCARCVFISADKSCLIHSHVYFLSFSVAWATPRRKEQAESEVSDYLPRAKNIQVARGNLISRRCKRTECVFHETRFIQLPAESTERERTRRKEKMSQPVNNLSPKLSEPPPAHARTLSFRLFTQQTVYFL